MNTVNASTGFSPFQLKSAFFPCIILPFLPPPPLDMPSKDLALQVLREIKSDCMEAMDNLMMAKISQAHQANKARSPEIPYKIGDKVMLSTTN